MGAEEKLLISLRASSLAVGLRGAAPPPGAPEPRKTELVRRPVTYWSTPNEVLSVAKLLYVHLRPT